MPLPDHLIEGPGPHPHGKWRGGGSGPLPGIIEQTVHACEPTSARDPHWTVFPGLTGPAFDTRRADNHARLYPQLIIMLLVIHSLETVL
jgi:hypothetical protein